MRGGGPKPSGFSLEQLFGRTHVAAGLVAVSFDPRNLDFEKFDARIEFIQRIAIQAFAGQKARSPEVAFGLARSRSIFIVHCSAASNAIGLLSTGWRITSPKDVNLVLKERHG